MKFLFYITLALISSNILYAQETKNKAAPFVRVYDRNGEKISKGRIVSVTDTSLITGPREKPVNIGVSKIGFIKTKRSVGNNVLWGAAIGAGTGAILGLASGGEGEYWGKGEGAGGFGLYFGVIGAGIGGITAIFKKSNTYPIDGESIKWRAFKDDLIK